jgi:hypothetical protein
VRIDTLCFNGATSSQTWNSSGIKMAVAAVNPLQWGHVLSDVE